MTKIFLSYSSQSKPTAASLAHDIQKNGYVVWFDNELSGGQTWWDKICTNIEQSDVFIFVLDEKSLNSGACRSEWEYAGLLGKPILPVKTSKTVSVKFLPDKLAELQLVDYTLEGDVLSPLVRSINHCPSPEPLPEPMPARPAAPISYLNKLAGRFWTSDQEEQISLVKELEKEMSDGEVGKEEGLELLKTVRNRDNLSKEAKGYVDKVLNSGDGSVLTGDKQEQPAKPNKSEMEALAKQVNKFGVLSDGLQLNVVQKLEKEFVEGKEPDKALELLKILRQRKKLAARVQNHLSQVLDKVSDEPDNQIIDAKLAPDKNDDLKEAPPKSEQCDDDDEETIVDYLTDLAGDIADWPRDIADWPRDLAKSLADMSPLFGCCLILIAAPFVILLVVAAVAYSALGGAYCFVELLGWDDWTTAGGVIGGLIGFWIVLVGLAKIVDYFGWGA